MNIMEEKTFRLSLGPLLPQHIGYSREFPFEFSEIVITEDMTLHEFYGLVTASRTPQGILIQGDFQGKLNMECGRCLTTFPHTLHWQMTELYAFNRHSATEETDLILPHDAYVDITEFIIEDAQIEVPINPICKSDCQGLCQVCGANLNLEDCGHEDLIPEEPQEDSNSPFSGLKDLL